MILRFKIIVVGDPAIGKTSLILRYTERKFKKLYVATIGVQFSIKELILEADMFADPNIGKTDIELTIWDIAGQSKFLKMREMFYKGAHGVIIGFSLTDPDSFNSVNNWWDDIVQHCGELPTVLLGNKADLKDERKITPEQCDDKAKELNVPFFKTSALMGENVTNVFKEMAKSVMKKFVEEEQLF